jgi:anti-sigma factor RsiW
MNCDEVRLVLDDALDRRLDRADEDAVRAHLEVCTACTREREEIMALRERVAELPRSVEPPRDLWPEIEARIGAEKVVRATFSRRALLAAAAVVLVASSVVTAYLVGRRQATSEAVATPVVRPVTSGVLAASFAEIGVNDYHAVRQQLLDVLERRRDELSPATMDVVLSNLRLIDDAMDQIAEALGEDPGNELLMRQLVSIYRQQINLLERAAILPREI